MGDLRTEPNASNPMQNKIVTVVKGRHFEVLPTQERVHELLRIAEEAPPNSPMAMAVRDSLAIVHAVLLQRDEAVRQLNARVPATILDIATRVVAGMSEE